MLVAFYFFYTYFNNGSISEIETSPVVTVGSALRNLYI